MQLSLIFEQCVQILGSNFTWPLSNKIYTLSRSIVEICMEMINMCSLSRHPTFYSTRQTGLAASEQSRFIEKNEWPPKFSQDLNLLDYRAWVVTLQKQVTWLVVTEVRSESFGLVTERRHYNGRHMLRRIFIVQCGIARFLRAMRVFDIRISSSPLGYICAKFHFLRHLYCWASPWTKHGEKLRTQSLTQKNHPAYLMRLEPLRNTINSSQSRTSWKSPCRPPGKSCHKNTVSSTRQ